jgi:alpha-glucosidase (family GH31 glycosyl hydrolase)
MLPVKMTIKCNIASLKISSLFHRIQGPSTMSRIFSIITTRLLSLVTRSDGELHFDTRDYKLIFETQDLEVTTNMEDDFNVYGLGEVIQSLRLHKNFTRTMWAKYIKCENLLMLVMNATQSTEISTAHIQSTSSTSI